MRWLIKTAGDEAGPLDDAMVATLVKSGQVGPDTLLREESAASWVPFDQTPFASPSTFSNAQTLTTRPRPTSRILVWAGALAASVALSFALVSAIRGKSAKGASVAPPASGSGSAIIIAKEPQPENQLSGAADLSEAIGLLATSFQSRQSDGIDDASARLALWSHQHLTWSTLAARPETKRSLVMKDPDAELGKRLCWSGRVVDITAARSTRFPLYIGDLFDYNGDVLSFYAVGSTGALVERSPARICGIVTGAVIYSNSAGGVTHSVRVVGMFDLPENRNGYAPASRR